MTEDINKDRNGIKIICDSLLLKMNSESNNAFDLEANIENYDGVVHIYSENVALSSYVDETIFDAPDKDLVVGSLRETIQREVNVLKKYFEDIQSLSRRIQSYANEFELAAASFFRP